jgi:hypothetical protein
MHESSPTVRSRLGHFRHKNRVVMVAPFRNTEAATAVCPSAQGAGRLEGLTPTVCETVAATGMDPSAFADHAQRPHRT